MLLAFDDGLSLFLFVLVLGGLGHWLIRSLVRLQRNERRIYRTACLFAVLTGLASVFHDLSEHGIPTTADLLGTTFSAIFIGFIAAFGWYFVVALAFLSWEYGLAIPFRIWRSLKSSKRQRIERQRTEEQTRQDQFQREEQQRITNDEKRRCESEIISNRQKRDDVRFACQIFYDQHAGDLEALFPRTRLEEYFAMYLSDERSVEQVKVRGDQLQQLLKDLLARNGSSNNQQTSILDIRQRFDEQRKAISDADLDAESAQSLLSDIAREEQRVIREFHQR